MRVTVMSRLRGSSLTKSNREAHKMDNHSLSTKMTSKALSQNAFLDPDNVHNVQEESDHEETSHRRATVYDAVAGKMLSAHCHIAISLPPNPSKDAYLQQASSLRI